jgi:hypothetical protein
MIVGDGLAARPIPAAKYEFRQCWRALRALIGVALLTTGTLALSSGARPATAATPGEARSGTLILKNTDENYTDATRLGIDVDVTVSGPTLRARITQVFRNTTNDWVEAIYVYPLPDGGAVDTLKMVIGDRVVVGGIKERQQARAVYEQAKQNGHKAALTEQQRPNIFTNSVANVGPGETVLVQIEYQGVRRSVFAAHPDGRRAALQPGAGRADRRFAQGRQRLGRRYQRSRSGPRPHLAAGARPEGPRAGQSDHNHHPPAGGISARRSEEPLPQRQDRESE